MKTKKLLSFFVIMAMLLSLIPMNIALAEVGSDVFAVGSGTSTDPYQISDLTGLEAFRDSVNNGDDYTGVYVQLTADITMPTTSWTPIGNDSTHQFNGNFDGNGKSINGLMIKTKADYQGFFGYIATTGNVEKLTVNGSIDGQYFEYKGGVTAVNNGTISDCVNNVSIERTRDYAGGIVGENKGTIKNCVNIAKVKGTYRIGGIAAKNSGTISNCSNSGTVEGGNNPAGGIVGYNAGNMTCCYNTGNVKGLRAIGGISGRSVSGSMVENSYNTGNVSGSKDVGGIVGDVDTVSSVVKNCYNIGTIAIVGDSSSKECGGLIGRKPSTGKPLEGDSYYLASCADENTELIVLEGTAKVESAFRNGEVAFLLQNAQKKDASGNIPEVWGQTLTGDTPNAAPVLGGTKVYKSGRTYSNTQGETGEDTDVDLSEYFKSGSGTSIDPYKISTPVELAVFCGSVNSGDDYEGVHIQLTKDLTIITSAWTPIGKDSTHQFNGIFDGNEKSISGIVIDATSSYHGFFGYIDAKGKVEKLTLNGSGEGHWRDYVGGISAVNNGTISDCVNNISIKYVKKCFGGIAGSNTGTIKNCSNIANIDPITYYSGGVAGENSGTIEGCFNTGNISSSNGQTGGIVGVNYYATVKGCYNTGDISSSGGGGKVGGIIGDNQGYEAIENCYNTGNISGVNKVGGIVGDGFAADEARVRNCYSTGTIAKVGSNSSPLIGGLIGYGAIGCENSYYVSDCAGENTTLNVEAGTAKNASAFGNGEVAYLLQNAQTADASGKIPEVWGQMLTGTNKNTAPILGGAKVYNYGSAYSNAEKVSASRVDGEGANANGVYGDNNYAAAFKSDEIELNKLNGGAYTWVVNKGTSKYAQEFESAILSGEGKVVIGLIVTDIAENDDLSAELYLDTLESTKTAIQ